MKPLLSRWGATAVVGVSSVGLVLGTFGSAIGQSVTTWKTVSDAKTGISVSMPAGATVKPSARLDEKTGAKMASFEVSKQSDASIYILVAIRMNDAAIGQLRKTVPAGKEPLDTLYASKVQPQVDRLLSLGDQGANHAALQRKPITWHGLRGEDISGIIKGQKGKGGVLHLRILKNSNSIYVQFAGERVKTAEGTQRMDRFFKSFTVAANSLK